MIFQRCSWIPSTNRHVVPRIIRIGVNAFYYLWKFSSRFLVIHHRLLASAYPASKNQEEQRLITEKLIIDHPINVIINLMVKKELTHFVPYEDLMKEYAKKGIFFYRSTLKSFVDRNIVLFLCRSLVNRSLEFVSFPIRDQHIDENHERVLEFCLDLCQRLKRGQILLIHCWSVWWFWRSKKVTFVSCLLEGWSWSNRNDCFDYYWNSIQYEE